jgi:LmbE family N-acetylglucosaminyl deacetylase
MFKKLSIFCLLLVALGFQDIAHAGIMIVSPHPDDDIVAFSGVIARAIARGETVTIVYVTNGDHDGGTSLGYQRELEAVNGEVGIQGLNEDNLIFLGYPDGHLADLLSSYPNQSDQFNTPFGQSTTYANRGLGRTDYHSYRFGSPATYNAYNVVADLKDVISVYQPSQILTTSVYDSHPDHSTTYKFLTSALQTINIPNYVPAVHETIVWDDDNTSWPNPLDASAYFAEIPYLSMISNGQLVWSQRQSIDVPLAMQSTNYQSNPKYLAVAAQVSQGGTGGFLGNFIHKDEIFWSRNLLGANQPPIVNAGLDQSVSAGSQVTLDGSGSSDPEGNTLTYQWQQVSGPNVTLTNLQSANPSFVAPANLPQTTVLSFELVVSDGQFSSLPDAVSVTVNTAQPYGNIALLAAVTASSQNPSTGQTAVKAVDGVVDGYPGDYTKEWATAGQGAGAWLKLTWTSTYTVDHVVLHDRPNSNDQILSATLSFNDGSTVQVGQLDNTGAGVTVSFPAKNINQMTMTVNTVSSKTSNVGLAEIEVYGSLSGSTNHAPVANAGPDQTVAAGAQVSLNGTGSTDIDGDTLSYQWQQLSGASVQLANPQTATPSFTAPTGLSQDAVLTFQLSVSDGHLNSTDTVVITVTADQSTYANIAPSATVTASSQNTGTGQTAAKAVDGVVDGYPGDYTKEWATAGQGAGAWLKLTWTSPYVVDKVVLYDRPNQYDQILSATLSFSDGSTVPVGSLDNTGAATTITFAPKTVNQVTLTVNTVSGTTANVGLAEIQVYGSKSTGDHPPVANAGPDQTVSEGAQVTLNGTGSSDPDGDAVTYQWQQLSGGTVQLNNPQSATPSFTAPTGLTQDAVLTFQLVVSDGQLNSGPDTVSVTVKAPQGYNNIASLATVTASSQNTATGQTAAKAVDGVAAGYPGDYTKEWATNGQGAGAWLKLTWSSAYVVDQIILFDRPNSSDQILSATLTFDDGSSVQVGALDNAGAGVVITFPPKTISQLTLTVNTVSANTYNVGLAEIQVFSSGAP